MTLQRTKAEPVTLLDRLAHFNQVRTLTAALTPAPAGLALCMDAKNVDCSGLPSRAFYCFAVICETFVNVVAARIRLRNHPVKHQVRCVRATPRRPGICTTYFIYETCHSVNHGLLQHSRRI